MQGANFNGQCNWFGTTNAAIIALQLTGNISFNPFLTDGTDTDPALEGFQPNTSTCVVLPILLTDFAAVVKNYDVLLNWQTAAEVNSSHFILERSVDNVRYTAIATVTAKGFSDVKTNYSFTDNKPVNFDRPTYYRLQMIDRDGSKKVSKIVSVTLKTDRSYVQQVYPNPVSAGTQLHTSFIASAAQSVHISLVNTTGQVIAKYEFKAVRGLNEFDIPVAKGTAGLSFLQLRTADIVKQVPVYIH